VTDTVLLADTVEARILALQERKRKLADAVVGDSASHEQKGSLTHEDLQYLFSSV
jgi:SNF2 family DNA or RNA helicase